MPSRFAPGVLDPLTNWVPDIARAHTEARDLIPIVVEADASVERLDINWAKVKTISEGVTVTGDDLSVWRAQQLNRSARQVLAGVWRGQIPELRAVEGHRAVLVDQKLDGPHRAMDFLIRATEAGADPAYVRHTVSGYLISHGYPWLWLNYGLGAEYRRALVAVQRQGDGNAMAKVLLTNVRPERWV